MTGPGCAVWRAVLQTGKCCRAWTPGSADLSYVREIATATHAGAARVVLRGHRQRLPNAASLMAWTAGRRHHGDGRTAAVLITFWQYRNACVTALGRLLQRARPAGPAPSRPHRALCIGFLWWNAAPAKIFMGDTGSLALGGVIGEPRPAAPRILVVVLGAVRRRDHLVVRNPDLPTTGRRMLDAHPTISSWSAGLKPRSRHRDHLRSGRGLVLR